MSDGFTPEEPVVAGPGHGRVARLRRGVDGSTVAILLCGAPKALVSALIVVSVVAGPASTQGRVPILIGWLATGLLLLLKPFQYLLAHVYFRLRRPLPAEERHLRRLWNNAAASAGVNPHRYTIWIDRSHGPNAFAASAHIVAVTEWAVRNMQPSDLEAILAHELGHHLRGHAWSDLLMAWYAWPAMLALRIATLFLRMLGAVAVVFFSSCFGWLVLLAAMCFAGGTVATLASNGTTLVGYVVGMWTGVLVLLLFERFAGRIAEMSADRVAVQLGYGRPLLRALYRFQEVEPDARRPWHHQLSDTHPPVRNRILAIERRVGPLAAPPGEDPTPL